MGLKTIYSNIKFFIFQLICILAKMVITFEPVGIFSCGFRCCTQENKFCHLNMSSILRWGLFNWARSCENVSYDICEQQRCRSACESPQSDQHLCCSLLRYYDMYTCYIQSFKILASFCSWAGWFESYLVENLRRHVFAWYGSIEVHVYIITISPLRASGINIDLGPQPTLNTSNPWLNLIFFQCYIDW